MNRASSWWKAHQKELGSFNAALYAVHRVVEKLSFGKARIVRYAICVQPIDPTGMALVRGDASTAVKIWQPETDGWQDSFPRERAIIEARHAAGAICYVAKVKNRFAGYIWIARDAYLEDEVRCQYLLEDPVTCVWDYDVYVEPQFRLGRTMGRLWKAVAESLSSQGVSWTFSRISAFNPGSMASHKRLGAVVCSTATFFVLGPLQVAFLSQRPFLWVSFQPDSGPRLPLRPPSASGPQRSADAGAPSR